MGGSPPHEAENVFEDPQASEAAVTGVVSGVASHGEMSDGDDDFQQDNRFIEPETLNTLTQLIHQFSGMLVYRL